VLAGLITAAILGAVLMIARNDPQPPSGGDDAADTPQACIDRMFQSATDGDVDGYLNCFTGEERERLQRELSGQSREAFGHALAAAVAELKGRAVYAAGDPSADGAETSMIVERIYASRMERQTYELTREKDGYRISAVQAASSHQPDKPYGTPVFE
jgi:hypothetical protein